MWFRETVFYVGCEDEDPVVVAAVCVPQAFQGEGSALH